MLPEVVLAATVTFEDSPLESVIFPGSSSPQEVSDTHASITISKLAKCLIRDFMIISV
jgi:hypothetical protein